MTSFKTCTGCGVLKELNDFYKDYRSTTERKHLAQCKECTNKRSAETYRRHQKDPIKKAKRKELANKRNKESKLRAIEYKGGRCADCGYKGHHCVFDFHHLDPSVKEGNPSAILRKDNWKEEIDKCVLLCANCHRLRHFGDVT